MSAFLGRNGKAVMRSVLLAAITVMAYSAALASPVLTCDAFRQRLDEEIRSAGNKVAHIRTYVRALEDKDLDVRRFDWSGIVGLHGVLYCKFDDTFKDFEANAEYESENEYLEYTQRLKDMSAAAFCALAQGDYADCDYAVRVMFAGSEVEYQKSKKRGEESPEGTKDFSISTTVQAEFIMSDGLTQMSIGPRLGETTAQDKLPFRLQQTNQ